MLLPVLAGLAGLAMMGNPPRKRRKARRKNPPRDAAYQGAFTLGKEPKKAGYVDGDTAAVQTPHVRHTHLDRDYEVWVFGMVDPRLGDNWNYVSGPMAKSDAIEEAKRLAGPRGNPKGWTWAHAKARAARKAKRRRKA